MAYDDLVACGSVAAAREKGLYRMEGKEYVVEGRRRAALQVQRVAAADPSAVVGCPAGAAGRKCFRH